MTSEAGEKSTERPKAWKRTGESKRGAGGRGWITQGGGRWTGWGLGERRRRGGGRGRVEGGGGMVSHSRFLCVGICHYRPRFTPFNTLPLSGPFYFYP